MEWPEYEFRQLPECPNAEGKRLGHDQPFISHRDLVIGGRTTHRQIQRGLR